MHRSRHTDLIALELASCIQKLAFVRGGGMTPRSFPENELAVISAFGLSCCRLGADAGRARSGVATGNYAFDADGQHVDPMGVDEDTAPGWRQSEKPTDEEAPADTKDTKP